MSKLLVTTVCAILALPLAAVADNDHSPPHQQTTSHASSSHGGDQHYGHNDGNHNYGDHDPNHYGAYHDHGYTVPRYYGYAPVARYYPAQRYYPAPHYYYPAQRYYPAQHYYGGSGHHHDGSDNDDALWAIGGLIVGAVVGHAIEHSSANTAALSTQHAPTCNDSVAYDSDGNPYVKRDCR